MSNEKINHDLINKMVNESDKVSYEMILKFFKNKNIANKVWIALSKFNKLDENEKINSLKEVKINNQLTDFVIGLVGQDKAKEVIESINKLNKDN